MSNECTNPISAIVSQMGVEFKSLHRDDTGASYRCRKYTVTHADAQLATKLLLK